MKVRAAAFAVCGLLASGSPSFADARSDAKAQVEFGINVAQRGLWREGHLPLGKGGRARSHLCPGLQ
jgi:hypothetical protein